MPHSTMTSQATNLDIDRATLIHAQQVILESLVPSRQDTPTPSNIQDEINNDNISNPLLDQPTPSLAQAIVLMTEELRQRDSPSKQAQRRKNLIPLTVLTLRSSTTSYSSVTSISETTPHTPNIMQKSLLPLLIFKE